MIKEGGGGGGVPSLGATKQYTIINYRQKGVIKRRLELALLKGTCGSML